MSVLSYIIPVYNGERFLRETLESVVNQPCKDFEVVIINDGSTDSSEDIIREYVQKYENVKAVNRSNSGVSVSRNIGLRLAQGDYVIFLDQDDIIVNGAYCNDLHEDLIRYKEREVDIIAFSAIYGNKDCSRFRVSDNYFFYNEKNECMLLAETPVHYAFYSREFLLKNSLFCFEKYKRIDTDQQYFHKVYMTAKNIELRNDIKFYIFRSNFSSVSHSYKNASQHLQILNAWYEMHLWNKKNNYGGADFCVGWMNGCFYFALLECANEKSPKDELDELFDGVSEYKSLLFDTSKCAFQEYIDGFELYKKSPKAFYRKARRSRMSFNIQLKLKNIKLISDFYEKKRYPFTSIE